jgi:hypothetical protein
MKRRMLLGALAALFFCCPACDRGPGNSLIPEQTFITVLSSKTSYVVGETDTFTATLASASGAIRRVTDGLWRSDAPSVATVNDRGLVTITGEGWATITCTSSGLTGEKSIQGCGQHLGTWEGTYGIEACEASGDFLTSGFCDNHKGSGYPIELDLWQENGPPQGIIRLGSLSIPVTSNMELDLQPWLTGQIRSDPYVIKIMIFYQQTDSGPTFVFGPMGLTYTSEQMSGSARLHCGMPSL